jgi:hypothetical protein
MVITNILGGLGNQMFQYAAGKALAARTNQTLKLDITSFEEYKLRNFDLDCFNINYEVATTLELAAYKKNRYSILSRFLNKLFPKNFFSNKKIYREPFYHFDPEFFKIRNSVYLFGYWQTEKYFLDIKSEILKDFLLRSPISQSAQNVEADIIKANAVSLHVRRGDYVSNPDANSFHGTCSLDYYKKAVDLISESHASARFFIFSDDIEWCKKHFDFINNPYYVELDKSAPDCEEMYLMSQCKHNIIANSSFSWWGAWLNLNPDKMVVAPIKWFADESINTSDLIPESWIRL